MIRTLIGSQLISALCVSFASISATPCMCGALSPDESFVCSDCVYLVSHNPAKANLYFIISRAASVAFPASFIVLTFQVPILVVLLGVSRLDCIAFLRLSLCRVGLWEAETELT